jgi:tetratricopeptide (TPR) repeat protein
MTIMISSPHVLLGQSVAQPLSEGIRLYQRSEYTNAAVFFMGIESTGNTDEVVFLWQARALLKAERLPDAQAAIQRGLTHHEESAELTYWLGHILAMEGRKEEAKAEFRKIAATHVGARSELNALEGNIAISRETPPTLPMLSPVVREPTESTTDVSTLVEEEMSSETRTAFLAGRSAMAADTYDGYCRAIKEYERAAAMDPSSALIATELAYARLWRAIVNRESHRFSVFGLLGTPTHSKEDIRSQLRQAEAEARSAVAMNPRGSAGHAILAIVLNEMGEHKMAQKESQAAQKAAPGDRHALMAAYVLSGDAPQRLAAAERLVALDPHNAQFLNWLAAAQLNKNKRKDAIQSLRKASGLSPKGSQAALHLAVLDQRWGGLKRLCLLVDLKSDFSNHSSRLRFEQTMILLQFGYLLLLESALLLGGVAWYYQWQMRKASTSLARAKSYRGHQTMWKWCSRLFLLLVVYMILTIPITYPVMRCVPGTITAGLVPPCYFQIGGKILLCMVLFWRPYNRLWDSGRWLVALGVCFALPMVAMIWGLDPWVHKGLTALVDAW